MDFDKADIFFNVNPNIAESVSIIPTDCQTRSRARYKLMMYKGAVLLDCREDLADDDSSVL